jgi:hypothetical protein
MLIFFVIFFFSGCDMNTSVDFILEEPKIQSENGIDFSVDWRLGIPLYYFKYNRQNTSFLIRIDVDNLLENVHIQSYEIRINELDVNFKTKVELSDVIITDLATEPNSVARKKYYGGKRIEVDSTILLDIIQNEQQLVEFKKVKYVFLTTVIEYTINGEQKLSTITWRFRPRVWKSSALWDKWMSV